MNDSLRTYGQYRIVRILLGAYLLVHFLHLLPWGAEVFARGGAIAQARLSPLMGVLPNPLALSDAPWMVTLLLSAGVVGAIALIVGRASRIAAVLLACVLAWLYARNPLIANPSLPVVGWMLLFHACLPRPRTLEERAAWRVPQPMAVASWVLLAVAYTYSGYTKLLSPSWMSGDAIAYVLQNPLARDHVLRAWLADQEGLLRALTWGVLYLELAFAPLALSSRLRPWLWLGMLGAQFGFLTFLRFADLTFPMLLIHLLAFDPRWVRGSATQATLYYDGECGFCHRLVRLAALEDARGRIRFAPLQGRDAAGKSLALPAGGAGDSIVLLAVDGGVAMRSDAAIEILLRLGGLWTAIGAALIVVPRPLRDAAYGGVGRIRRVLSPKPETWCPMVPASVQARWLA